MLDIIMIFFVLKKDLLDSYHTCSALLFFQFTLLRGSLEVPWMTESCLHIEIKVFLHIIGSSVLVTHQSMNVTRKGKYRYIWCQSKCSYILLYKVKLFCEPNHICKGKIWLLFYKVNLLRLG